MRAFETFADDVGQGNLPVRGRRCRMQTTGYLEERAFSGSSLTYLYLANQAVEIIIAA